MTIDYQAILNSQGNTNPWMQYLDPTQLGTAVSSYQAANPTATASAPNSPYPGWTFKPLSSDAQQLLDSTLKKNGLNTTPAGYFVNDQTGEIMKDGSGTSYVMDQYGHDLGWQNMVAQQQNDNSGEKVLDLAVLSIAGATAAGLATAGSLGGTVSSISSSAANGGAVLGSQSWADGAALSPYTASGSSIVGANDFGGLANSLIGSGSAVGTTTGAATGGVLGSGAVNSMIDPALAQSVYGDMLGNGSNALSDITVPASTVPGPGGGALNPNAVIEPMPSNPVSGLPPGTTSNTPSGMPDATNPTGGPDVGNPVGGPGGPTYPGGGNNNVSLPDISSWLKPIADILGGAAAAKSMSDASDKAAQIQADTAQKQLDFLKENRDIALKNNQPFLDTAYGAMNKMNQMVGNPTVATPGSSNSVMNQPGYMPGPNQSGGVLGMSPADIMAMDPGYQFRLDQGMKALGYSQAANGYSTNLSDLNNGGSGGFAKAAIRYSQGYASSEFQNIYNRLGTLAGYGVPASANNNSALNTSSIGGSNAIDTAGTSSAYNALNQGNITASLIGNIANQDWGSIFNRHG